MKNTAGRKIFVCGNYLLMILFMLTILYPLINVLAVSLSEGLAATYGKIYLLPKNFSTDAYRIIFEEEIMFRAFINSISRSLLGTVTALLFSSGAAFILSKKDLIARRLVIFVFVFTMYINGGIIPYFILISNLNLIDNFLVYIIPTLLNVWNVMIMRAYFEEIPESLVESAEIAGANGFQIFTKVILPVSKPVLATIALFIAVAQWNSWYDTYVYTNSKNLLTLQGMLIKILMESQANLLANNLSARDMENMLKNATPETIKMATIIVSTLPIVIVYPFLQKYFIKGIMVGAVKG